MAEVFTNYVASTEAAVKGEFSPELQKKFYEAAFAIARKKIAEGEARIAAKPPKKKILPRLATGGGFSGLFVWDTCFCVLWAKYDMSLPVTTSLDNFYNLLPLRYDGRYGKLDPRNRSLPYASHFFTNRRLYLPHHLALYDFPDSTISYADNNLFVIPNQLDTNLCGKCGIL